MKNGRKNVRPLFLQSVSNRMELSNYSSIILLCKTREQVFIYVLSWCYVAKVQRDLVNWHSCKETSIFDKFNTTVRTLPDPGGILRSNTGTPLMDSNFCSRWRTYVKASMSATRQLGLQGPIAYNVLQVIRSTEYYDEYCTYRKFAGND